MCPSFECLTIISKIDSDLRFRLRFKTPHCTIHEYSNVSLFRQAGTCMYIMNFLFLFLSQIKRRKYSFEKQSLYVFLIEYLI